VTPGAGLKERLDGISRGTKIERPAMLAELEERLDRPPTDAEIGELWGLVLAANAELLPEPGNPDLIFVGQTVLVPADAIAP
jgi:hypothetical protein